MGEKRGGRELGGVEVGWGNVDWAGREESFGGAFGEFDAAKLRESCQVSFEVGCKVR